MKLQCDTCDETMTREEFKEHKCFKQLRDIEKKFLEKEFLIKNILQYSSQSRLFEWNSKIKDIEILGIMNEELNF